MLQNIQILTIFPDAFELLKNYSIVGKAIKNKKIKVKVIDFRGYSENKHKKVDDYPYGHNPGMLLKCQPIVDCLEKNAKKSYKILLTPKGKKYNQKIANNLVSKYKSITFICGHYEGIDARVNNFVDETISIGDFITSGGETVALTIIDSLIRLIPGVINPDSLKNESFLEKNHFEYDQYTRPYNFRGIKVPNVLVNGNHKLIKKWKKKNSKKIKQK